MSRGRFLAAAVGLFEETGEFPLLKPVQRELEGWRDDTNARREARRLPPSFGSLEGERVVLGVRAFERAEPSSPVLERFPAGLHEALTIYRRRDRVEVPTISVADLIRQAGMSELRAHQVLQLLAAEKLVEKVRSGVWEVLPPVRHYRSVRTVDDYLRKKRAYERHRCWAATICKPIHLVRRALGKEGPARAVLVAAAGILLAAAVAWVVRDFAGGSDQPTVPHRLPHADAGRQRPGP
jgi:hypothetical protein